MNSLVISERRDHEREPTEPYATGFADSAFRHERALAIAIENLKFISRQEQWPVAALYARETLTLMYTVLSKETHADSPPHPESGS